MHAGIHVSFHGHDSSGAAQVIVVLDGDTGRFCDATNSRRAGFVTFSVAASRTWNANESGFHVESVIGAEFFVGIKFGCECG